MAEKTFDEAVTGAWRRFRQELAQQLETLPPGQFLRVGVCGDEPDDGALPYVQVVADGAGSFRVEATSNHYLADAVRLRRPQQQALRAMGWGPVARAVDGEPPAERDNYWLVSGDAEWIAVLTMRALREVYGVVDPAFVAYAGWGHDEGQAADDDALMRERLEEILQEIPGSHDIPDDDGDFCITVAEFQTVYVRPDASMIHVFTHLDPGVPTASLERVAGRLNSHYWGPTFSVFNNAILMAGVTIEAEPLVAEHVRRSVARFCRAVQPWLEEATQLAHELDATDDELEVEEAGEEVPYADQEPDNLVRHGHLSVDGEDYMTAVVALDEMLQIGDLDSASVAELFDWSVDRMRVAVAEQALLEEPDPRLRDHLRRGLRRVLRRSVGQDSRIPKRPRGQVTRD